jgi:hypothetical protein
VGVLPTLPATPHSALRALARLRREAAQVEIVLRSTQRDEPAGRLAF